MMRKLILPILALSTLAAPALPGSAVAYSENIAVVVNEDAISNSDVEDRMKLIMVSSGLPNSQEIRDKVRQQVLGVLIDEQIRLQEAERLELEVSQEEIDGGFKTIAGKNNMSPDQFKSILNKSGINIETMYRQIRAQLSWTKVIQSEVRPRISIRSSDIQAELQRLKNNIGKTEYLLAEIYLPVEDSKDQSQVFSLASRLSQEIKAGASFVKVAQEFSQSAGAARGGDLGWVQNGQLPEAIDEALPNLPVDTPSSPIKSLTGYHILLLRDKREITEDNMPSEEQITNKLGLIRLERAQDRLMMDLKTSAYIDSRV